MILPFKYGDRIETARALAPMMARAGAALLREADLLVPVPLHRRRLVARRYNQAALLARALARLSRGRRCWTRCAGSASTPPLAEMSPARRAAELAGRDRGAADAGARRCADARVLLIDDMLTSGADGPGLRGRCSAAGAVRVDVLAAARVRVAALGRLDLAPALQRCQARHHA